MTFVFLAGTNNLLLDAVVGIESKNGVEEIVVQPRIEYAKAAPGGITAMLGLETYVRHCGFERSLMFASKVSAVSAKTNSLT